MTATAELARRENNRDRALALLREKRRVSNIELVAIAGLRAGARVFELRREGHEIQTEMADGGLCFYVYKGFRAVPQGRLF